MLGILIYMAVHIAKINESTMHSSILHTIELQDRERPLKRPLW